MGLDKISKETFEFSIKNLNNTFSLLPPYSKNNQVTTVTLKRSLTPETHLPLVTLKPCNPETISPMKYLITGSSGQLAKEFISHFKQSGMDYIAPAEDVLDITDSDIVERVFGEYKPDVIINCAAYNAVDAAEQDSTVAFRVNSDAVAILAAAARKHGARIVHYGSDYVFDGKTDHPNHEDSPTNPLNAYGRSKLAGEEAVIESGADFLHFRLSWVYGNGNQNFFHKLMQWSDNNEVLKVVWDQISVPTYTEDIVAYTLAALEKGLTGVYHLTNSGYATRYEMARYFFKCLGKDITIIPVNSDMFPSPVTRPFFSVMSNKKLTKALGSPIPTWENAVKRFVKQL